jgi:hypothetical protein
MEGTEPLGENTGVKGGEGEGGEGVGAQEVGGGWRGDARCGIRSRKSVHKAGNVRK